MTTNGEGMGGKAFTVEVITNALVVINCAISTVAVKD